MCSRFLQVEYPLVHLRLEVIGRIAPRNRMSEGFGSSWRGYWDGFLDWLGNNRARIMMRVRQGELGGADQ